MLGEAIRHYMIQKGLRPTDLTVGLNAPHMSSVSRVIRGVTRDPRISTLVHVCRLIEVDPTLLLTRAGMWPEPASQAASASAQSSSDSPASLAGLHERAGALPQELREMLRAQLENLLESLESLARARGPDQ